MTASRPPAAVTAVLVLRLNLHPTRKVHYQWFHCRIEGQNSNISPGLNRLCLSLKPLETNAQKVCGTVRFIFGYGSGKYHSKTS